MMSERTDCRHENPQVAQLAELLEPGDKALDTDIRAMAKSIAKDLAEFRILIERARTENLWERLGFKSWTAYISDVISRSMTALAVDDRRAIVAVLDDEGMSQRAIAAAIGVSQKTVDRDLDELSRDDSVAQADDSDARRTGLDGKSRPAHPKRKPAPPVTPPAAPQGDDDPPESTPVTGLDIWLMGHRLRWMSKALRSERPLQFSSNERIQLADILTETIIPWLEEALAEEDDDANQGA